MLLTEVTVFMNEWEMGQTREFDYHFTFFEPAVVVIRRWEETKFEVDEARSTDKVGPFDKIDIEKMLLSGKIKLRGYGLGDTNPRTWLAGGCECGAWKTLNKNLHARWCPKYKE